MIPEMEKEGLVDFWKVSFNNEDEGRLIKAKKGLEDKLGNSYQILLNDPLKNTTLEIFNPVPKSTIVIFFVFVGTSIFLVSAWSYPIWNAFLISCSLLSIQFGVFGCLKISGLVIDYFLLVNLITIQGKEI
eukprot:GHVP01040577.1.p1 GENE.GHVP01040577.1~~GHVP01040577.1.p1  ORF type:complete len:131 (+),score=23.18 GHVP01040577.1:297-689(+)